MSGTRVILASESPYKSKVLRDAGIAFETVPSAYEEDMTLKMAPLALAKELALGKARAVAERHPDAVVIATDVFVEHRGRIHGKPRTPEKARETLLAFRGEEVDVVCGVAVIKDGEERTHVDVAKLLVRDDLTEQEIDGYIATGEPLDKGGSFSHNLLGANLMAEERGDHTTIIGLPLYTTLRFLRECGVNPLVTPCRR